MCFENHVRFDYLHKRDSVVVLALFYLLQRRETPGGDLSLRCLCIGSAASPGEELIWEAAMMIFICDIAPAVAGI